MERALTTGAFSSPTCVPYIHTISRSLMLTFCYDLKVPFSHYNKLPLVCKHSDVTPFARLCMKRWSSPSLWWYSCIVHTAPLSCGIKGIETMASGKQMWLQGVSLPTLHCFQKKKWAVLPVLIAVCPKWNPGGESLQSLVHPEWFFFNTNQAWSPLVGCASTGLLSKPEFPGTIFLV